MKEWKFREIKTPRWIYRSSFLLLDDKRLTWIAMISEYWRCQNDALVQWFAYGRETRVMSAGGFIIYNSDLFSDSTKYFGIHITCRTKKHFYHCTFISTECNKKHWEICHPLLTQTLSHAQHKWTAKKTSFPKFYHEKINLIYLALVLNTFTFHGINCENCSEELARRM